MLYLVYKESEKANSPQGVGAKSRVLIFKDSRATEDEEKKIYSPGMRLGFSV